MDIREAYNWDGSRGRRRLAYDKLELLRGEHLNTLRAVIRSRMSDPGAAQEVMKWANTSRNLLRQIVLTCCIAYARGCVRDLPAGQGATDAVAPHVSPEAAHAFAAVLAESKIGALAPLVNQYAWLLGPSFVVPQIDARGRFTLSLVPPSRAEVRRVSEDAIDALFYQRTDGLYVQLDEQGWSFYDAEGEPVRGLPSIDHGLGYAPVALFRGEPDTEDWWSATSHRALVDAALHVAALQALMDWKLKVSGKQLIIQAPPDSLGGKQIIGHPEAPLYFAGVSGVASVEVLDLTQNAAAALDSINATIVSVCDLYGLPPSALSGVANNTDWGTVGLARTPEVLDSLRDRQIPGMRDGEVQLWPAVCDLLRGSIHKHARALPPGDEVRDMLNLRFLEPLPNIDRALKRLQLFTEQEKLGLATVADLVIEERPELTREQAEQITSGNLVAALARWDALAAHNATGDSAGTIESLAAAQGRTGGLQRVANAAAQAAPDSAENPS